MRKLRFYRREEVAEQFQLTIRTLERYEKAGFVQSETHEGERVYRASEVRRLWTIVSLQRDLGVNLAGVEVILHMRERMDALIQQMSGLARWTEELARSVPRPRGRRRD